MQLYGWDPAQIVARGCTIKPVHPLSGRQKAARISLTGQEHRQEPRRRAGWRQGADLAISIDARNACALGEAMRPQQLQKGIPFVHRKPSSLVKLSDPGPIRGYQHKRAVGRAQIVFRSCVWHHREFGSYFFFASVAQG